MSAWLLIIPALVWLVMLTYGRWALRTTPDAILHRWRPGIAPVPYDPQNFQHAALVRITRAQGWLLLFAACFITFMSILVAVGLVPAARP